MGITFQEKERVFHLDTKNTSYQIGVVDKEGFIGHIYYGKRVDEAMPYLLRTEEGPYVPSKNNRDRMSFLDCFFQEYPTHGLGDYREDCLAVRTAGGHTAVGLLYESHTVYPGKKPLCGLPATFGTEKDCTTLEIACRDAVLNLSVTLYYTVFEDTDVIARHVSIKNEGTDTLYITKALSASLDIDLPEAELITLHGSWARERHINRRPLTTGKMLIDSMRGEPGHQDNPFMAVLAKGAEDDYGEVFGMSFVYSGNFAMQAQMTQFETVRMTAGINPVDFTWRLQSGETFETPEALLVYSAEGLGGMTRNLHDVFRRHLIRSKYKDQKRPVLINNWEATYFHFDTDKLLAIAKQASALGIEMLVMDDGWFGTRESDNCALGDWFVNEEKLKGGLAHLVEEVNKLGMKFGIWFEPEMVSPDSDLYRAHPDWAIQIPGRTPTMAREQYVLDISRKEVRDAVYDMMCRVLRSANIEYVKWDMNRALADLGSSCLEPDRQGELFHRYVLGVYELQERLLSDFPDLLLENCSGGGARFDAGMLYYSPQIWCSDDTDAIERLAIQEGTALVYPLSAMGAHVSDCPNHTVGRVTPFETRGYVALAGTFGYELDVTKIPEADRAMIPGQIAMYHKYNALVREGDYYRIASYAENHAYDCYMVVSKDKREALCTFVQVLNRANYKSRRIRLKGLKAETRYRIEGTGEVFTGAALMNGGILIGGLWGDFKGKLLYFTAED